MSGANTPEKNSQWVPIIVSLIGASAVILVGYWQFAQEDETRNFAGRVVNAKTEQVIRGAKVTLETKDASPVTITDSEGSFSFPLKSSSDQIHIRVEAEGYDNFDRFTVPSAKSANEDIKLSPTRVTPLPTIPPSPSPTPKPIQTSLVEPKPAFLGEWIGTYTCSLGITGVTVSIKQDGKKISAIFHLYPLPNNSDISPGVPKYEGSPGIARYEGDFDSTSRYMRFPEGKWDEAPGPSLLWTAVGFHGNFDEKFQTFSGKMERYTCTNINLRRKDS